MDMLKCRQFEQLQCTFHREFSKRGPSMCAVALFRAFVGYSATLKAWWFWDPESRTVKESIPATFDEHHRLADVIDDTPNDPLQSNRPISTSTPTDGTMATIDNLTISLIWITRLCSRIVVNHNETDTNQIYQIGRIPKTQWVGWRLW